MVRSLLAMIGGYVVITVLVVMANAVVFHGAALEGPPELLMQVILLAMSALAAIVGGYVAAAIGGRRHQLAHGAALGALVAAVGMAMLVGGQSDMGPANEPRWFALALLAVGFGGATLGGVVRGHIAVPEPASQQPDGPPEP